MPRSAYQLFRDRVDPSQIGNPRLRQQVRRLQEQNYQQQLAQVNQNFQAGLAQGLTPGEAATTWVSGGQGGQYTIKDGDTLDSIAERTGSSPDMILNSNPDMRAPQTGMVINTPAFQAPTATGGGGVGLPSNAPLGGTTNNPGGFNRYASATPTQLQTYGAALGAAQNRPPTPPSNGFNDMRRAQMGQPLGGQTAIQQLGGIRATAGAGLDALRLAQMGQTPRPATLATPQAGPTSTNQPSLIGGLPNAAGISRRNLTASALRLMEKVNDPNYTPTEAEILALQRHQLLKPSTPQANGGMSGNYSYGAVQRRRGYGGGGGGGGGPRPGGGGQGYAQRYSQDNDPPFSGGGGFRGLVNWRI